jgi:DNA-binding MarR family transcriptional regulator
MTIPQNLLDDLKRWSELTNHLSIRDFKKFMDQSSLSTSQVQALMRLHFGGEIAISELGDGLGISSPAASQMVDRLVQMGLVERTEHPQDRRIKRLAITSQGDALVCQGMDAQWKWMETLAAALAPDEQQTISQALVILIEKARRLAPPGGCHRPSRNAHRTD